MEHLQTEDIQRQGIDLLPRHALDLLHVIVTGIMQKNRPKWSILKSKIIQKIFAGHFRT